MTGRKPIQRITCPVCGEEFETAEDLEITAYEEDPFGRDVVTFNCFCGAENVKSFVVVVG